MELVNFSLPALLRKTNVKLLLMFICATICIIIIVTSSSRFAIPHYVSKVGNIDDGKPDRLLDLFGDENDNAVQTPGSEGGSEDPVIFMDSSNSVNFDDEAVISVAIGLAVTSHDEPHLNLENVAYRLPFLKTLLPSFCRTASAGFHYHFYVAFDVHDPHFHREAYMSAVDSRFRAVVSELCKTSSNVSLHFVQCNHDRNPAWAQNDAMLEAYLDHIQYYYRVNDDTEMLSPGWTEIFIKALKQFSPPNVGVVGPLHKGGNQVILTYDFVHRTHIDVFGYYYPRIFTDWFADNWMSEIYGAERTLKMPNVKLVHTEEAGQRYSAKAGKQKYLQEQIDEDRLTLDRYLKAVDDAQKLQQSTNSSLRRVISMSLWGSKPRYVYGALRNAQLLPVYFPGWTLRIYVERPSADGATSFQPVPSRIIGKLVALGVEIIYVDAERSRIPPMMWRFLIADDTDVDIFVVRDSDCRLSDRDFAVVTEWLKTDFAFHCIRDHPSHAHYPVLGGLWGARPRRLKSFIAVPWRDLMMGYRSDYVQDMQFLENAIWPSVQTNAAFCHDSVSCLEWPGAHPFPIIRIGTEHLGQVFDAFGNARDEDIQILLENRPLAQCTLAQNVTQDSIVKRTNESISHAAKKQLLGLNASDSMMVKDALLGHKINDNRASDGSVNELSEYNPVNSTDYVKKAKQAKHSNGNKSEYKSTTSGSSYDHIPD